MALLTPSAHSSGWPEGAAKPTQQQQQAQQAREAGLLQYGSSSRFC
jgi:hypothetical protein